MMQDGPVPLCRDRDSLQTGWYCGNIPGAGAYDSTYDAQGSGEVQENPSEGQKSRNSASRYTRGEVPRQQAKMAFMILFDTR
jgi:hypothetical protein